MNSDYPSLFPKYNNVLRYALLNYIEFSLQPKHGGYWCRLTAMLGLYLVPICDVTSPCA